MLRTFAQTRHLTRGEEHLARKVFAAALPYGRIYLADFYLLGSGSVPVTLASSPFRRRAVYAICWGDKDVFGKGADAVGVDAQASFIHELTHVWQGQHGRFAQGYMLRSVAAQCAHGIRDVISGRRWRGWSRHRRRAYDYSSKLGRPWSEFNVEQQSLLVEEWFRGWLKCGLADADEPIGDARYAYIVEHVRAGLRR